MNQMDIIIFWSLQMTVTEMQDTFMCISRIEII